MQTPRTVEELAALVQISSNKTLEESIKDNVWSRSFHDSLADDDLKLIFVFLVLATNIQSKDKDKQELALFERQNRVFSNHRTGIANIKFRDTDSVVEDIFG